MPIFRCIINCSARHFKAGEETLSINADPTVCKATRLEQGGLREQELSAKAPDILMHSTN